MSNEPGKWSIEEAGFITVEVFNRSDKASTLSLLTTLIGSSPEQPSKPEQVSTPRPSTTIDTKTWTLNEATIARVFSDPAKMFQIDIGPLLPRYRNVMIFLVDNPTVPYLLLAIRGAIFADKIDAMSIREPVREQLRKLSLPFRLFVEKLPGLSSQNASWSPHVANVTWAGVKVDSDRIDRLREVLKRIQLARGSGLLFPDQLDTFDKELRSYQPFDLADPVVNITSHVAAYSNVHVIVSQNEQPGVGLYRALSVTYLPQSPVCLTPFRK